MTLNTELYMKKIWKKNLLACIYINNNIQHKNEAKGGNLYLKGKGGSEEKRGKR